MEPSNPIAMEEGDLVEFLGRGGTGVLSFSTGADEPFSLVAHEESETG